MSPTGPNENVCRHHAVSYRYATNPADRTTTVTARCTNCPAETCVTVSDLATTDARFNALETAAKNARAALNALPLPRPAPERATVSSDRIVNLVGRFGVVLRRDGETVELHLIAAAGVDADLAPFGWSRAWNLTILGGGVSSHDELRAGQTFKRKYATEDAAEVARLIAIVNLIGDVAEVGHHGWERAGSGEKLETFIERRLRERNETRPVAVSSSAGDHSRKLRRMFGQGG